MTDKDLIRVNRITTQTLLHRITTNHAIEMAGDDVSGIPFTMTDTVDTELGTLRYTFTITEATDD